MQCNQGRIYCGRIYSWPITEGAPSYLSEDVDKECDLAMIAAVHEHTPADAHAHTAERIETMSTPANHDEPDR